MTSAEIRIAIATECGWKDLDRITLFWLATRPDVTEFDERRMDLLPDYFNSLDDMHEAEKVLTEREQCQYVEEIGKLAREEYSKSGRDPRSCEDREVIFWHLSATARQRAEAFLKTLGKWKE